MHLIVDVNVSRLGCGQKQQSAPGAGQPWCERFEAATADTPRPRRALACDSARWSGNANKETALNGQCERDRLNATPPLTFFKPQLFNEEVSVSWSEKITNKKFQLCRLGDQEEETDPSEALSVSCFLLLLGLIARINITIPVTQRHLLDAHTTISMELFPVFSVLSLLNRHNEHSCSWSVPLI